MLLAMINPMKTEPTTEPEQASQRIRRLKRALESRIIERTRELGAANDRLRKEIAERSFAENELRKQKEILQKIFDNIPVMISLLGADSRIELVNGAWERTLGWSLDEIVQQGVDVFAHIYPDPQVRRKVRDFITSANAQWADFGITVRDGRVINTTWARVRLSDGTSIGFGLDITERKRNEDALRESEERFRQVAENIREVFWIKSVELNRPIYISPAFETVWGQKREDFYEDLGRLLETVHADDRERVRRTFGSEFDVEYRIIRPDGTVRWIRDRAFRIQDSLGQIYRYAGIAEDITERKQAEEQLNATNEQLRALSARLNSAREEEDTRIAREIHDQFGSALTAMNWNLQEMQKIYSEPAGCGYAELHQKLDSMTRLADSMMYSVKRIASELRPSILDDLGLAEAIEWQLQQFEQQTKIRCYCASLPQHVRLAPAASTAVFRILQEALTNVLRHAHASSIEICIEESAAEFVLTIRDNGKGITEEKRSGKLSLGLLGMRERARLVGGEVDISGAPAGGTTVVVRVPVSLPAGPSDGAVKP